jgi:hypothetical protein
MTTRAEAGADTVDGLHRVTMPLGVHGIESVNVYVLPHGDTLTLVDCGIWHPEPHDDHSRSRSHRRRTRFGVEVWHG